MNTYQEQEIKSACLQDALHLLEEVAAYLKKFPIVPITQHLINRVEEFVNSPDAATGLRLSKEKSQEVELRKKRRTAVSETIVGLPVIEVEVQGDSLKMTLPHHFTWRTAISRLKNGLVLELKSSN